MAEHTMGEGGTGGRVLIGNEAMSDASRRAVGGAVAALADGQIVVVATTATERTRATWSLRHR